MVGARGSGVRCNGAMVQWCSGGFWVVVTVHVRDCRETEKKREKKKKVWSPKPFNQEPRPTAPSVGATGHVGACAFALTGQ